MASTAPRTPPAIARSALSVMSWPTIRPRPAPSADRTAISRTRARPRTSSRFATLMQVMRSKSPAAAANAMTAGFTSPRMALGSECTTPCMSRSHLLAMPRRENNAVSSALAASGNAPGRRRPITWSSAYTGSLPNGPELGMTGAQKSVPLG